VQLLPLLLAGLVLVLGAPTAWAADPNPASSGTYSMQNWVDGGFTDSDDLTVDPSISITIQMDANSPKIANFTIGAGSTVTIDFLAFGNKFKIGDGATAGTITYGSATSVLRVAGTNASAGFQATANTNTAITITATAGSTPVNVADYGAGVLANNWFLADHGLTVSSANITSCTLDTIYIGGNSANTKLTFGMTTALTQIVPQGDFGVTIGQDVTVTVDNNNAITMSTGDVLTVTGNAGGGTETFDAEIVLSGGEINFVTAAVQGTGIEVDSNGGIIDADASCTVTMGTIAGNLTLEPAVGTTITGTFDIDANMLTLNDVGTVSAVTMDTAGGTLDVNASGTITTLTFTSNSTIDLDVDTKALTVTNPITLGAYTMSIVGSGAGGAETLTATVNMTSGSSSIAVTGADADNIGGLTVNVSADNATIDTDINTNFTAVAMTADTGDLTLQVGAKTFAGPITVNNNTLLIAEAGAGTLSSVTLNSASGVVDLNTAKTITALNATLTTGSATLHNGATLGGTITLSGAGGTLLVDETGQLTNVVISGAGATLDVNATCTVSGTFDLTASAIVDVAPTKTLTASDGIDTQTNTLTLPGTGTVSAVDLDGAAGSVAFSAAGTVTTLTTTALGTITANANATITTLSLGGNLGITFGNGVNLTVTNNFNVGANTLTLTGSGGGAQETFTTSGANGIVLNNNGSNLTVAETAAADDLTGFKVTVSGAVSPNIDINETCSPASITQTATAASTLTMTVAGVKTCTTTVNIHDNTLTLDGTGTVSTVTTGTTGGTLDVNESCTVGTLTLSSLAATEGFTLDVAGTKNLTITNAVSVPAGVILTYKGENAANTKTLTLTGGLSLAGNASELALTTDVSGTMAIAGTITSASNTSATIIDLNTKTNTLTDLELDDSCTIECDSSADTCTLTIASAVNVDAGAVLKFTGTDDANADTLTFTGGLSLNGAAAELEVSGDATTAMVVGGAVTGDTAGGIIDIDNTTTFSGTVDANAALTVDVANGETMTIANGVDTNTSTLTLSGTGTVSKVDIDGAGGAVNTTANGVITTLTQTASGSLNIDDDFTITNDMTVGATLAVDVAATKTLSFTNNNGTDDGFDVGANTLTVSGDGTIDEVTLDTAAFTLDVDDGDITVSSLNVSAAGTLDIATGQTWSHTFAADTNNLTLSGGGTLDTLTITVPDSATRTITVSTGVTPTITTFTPTWAGSGTLLFTTTGNLAVTSKLTPDAGNTVQKTGAGTLTLTGGFGLDNANVDLDIDTGTVVVGVAGGGDAAVNLTFGDDANSVDVANGATLTTFGAITGVAGGNTNFSVGATGTLNLNASAGKTLTIAQNNDFEWDGTINIAGTNSDYTLAGAFIYQMGSVNINTTGSLIYTVTEGKIDFQPGSTVTLTGNATLTLGSNTDGQEVILDTVGDTGTFTINRGASDNLTFDHTSVSRCTYASNSGCGATGDSITLTNVDLGTGTNNWMNGCPGPAGGGGYTPPANDNANENDNEPEQDDQFATDAANAVASSSGTATVSMETPSGTSARVSVSGLTAGAEVSATLEDGNSVGTTAGMVGGNGAGNAVPRTLTLTSSAEDGTFEAVVRLILTASDLATADVSGEQVGLYVYDQPTQTWTLAGWNNRGQSTPTGTVGDYGVYTDSAGRTVVWATVDHFSIFAAGEVNAYTLDTSASPEAGGSVTTAPSLSVYSEGMTVSLTATPASGYEFLGWSGDVAQADAGDPQLTVTMDAARSLVAEFGEVQYYYSLALTIDGENGGTVTVSPDQDEYLEGTVVTLTAVPANGYEFAGWSGDVTATTTRITVTMDESKSLAARFVQTVNQYRLVVAVDPIGAADVVMSPNRDYYDAGTRVTLTVVPKTGYSFERWVGSASSTRSTLTVTVNSDMQITAMMAPAQTLLYQLSIVVEPVRGGRVVMPAELTNEFEPGGTTTLTAVPEDGYEFVGWDGDVDGTDNPITVTVYDDTTVIARFQRIAGTPNTRFCGATGMIIWPLTFLMLVGTRCRKWRR